MCYSVRILTLAGLILICGGDFVVTDICSSLELPLISVIILIMAKCHGMQVLGLPVCFCSLLKITVMNKQ